MSIWRPLLGLSCLLLLAGSVIAEPVNLEQKKQQLIEYHDSGQYRQDIQEVVAKAKNYLLQRVKANKQRQNPQKLAIVFDIDETTLSNYPHIKKLHFGGMKQSIKKLEKKGNDPAIEPVLSLYRLARKHNVAVFFITGRNKNERQITVANLKKAGYTHWQKLYMKPMDYGKESSVPYKSKRRQDIENQGYNIIINIGDQQSDLKGGHADRTFKLPNPYYRIP